MWVKVGKFQEYQVGKPLLKAVHIMENLSMSL